MNKLIGNLRNCLKCGTRTQASYDYLGLERTTCDDCLMAPFTRGSRKKYSQLIKEQNQPSKDNKESENLSQQMSRIDKCGKCGQWDEIDEDGLCQGCLSRPLNTPRLFGHFDFVPEKTQADDMPKKYDENKPMMHLVRPEFILGMAEALSYGAKKYQEERGSVPNYMKGDGFNYSKIYDSLQRHLMSFQSGQSYDVGESEKHHLLLAACNIMFLYMYEISGKGKDDRFKIKVL